jgi:hypothetical protein
MKCSHREGGIQKYKSYDPNQQQDGENVFARHGGGADGRQGFWASSQLNGLVKFGSVSSVS